MGQTAQLNKVLDGSVAERSGMKDLLQQDVLWVRRKEAGAKDWPEKATPMKNFGDIQRAVVRSATVAFVFKERPTPKEDAPRGWPGGAPKERPKEWPEKAPTQNGDEELRYQPPTGRRSRPAAARGRQLGRRGVPTAAYGTVARRRSPPLPRRPPPDPRTKARVVWPVVVGRLESVGRWLVG